MIDPNARVTGAQAEYLTGISRQLIYDWTKRGRLAKGDDQRYRYGDILNLEAETRGNSRAGHFQRKPRQYAAV